MAIRLQIKPMVIRPYARTQRQHAAAGNDIAHAGVVVGKAAGSKHQTSDHGSERGNHLVHKAEQGAHQTGNILAGAVYFIVGTVGGHGNYDIAGNTLAAGIQDAEHNIGDQEGPQFNAPVSGLLVIVVGSPTIHRADRIMLQIMPPMEPMTMAFSGQSGWQRWR